MPVLVGTSGWQYRHWRGTFYPPDVPQRLWLEYYAERFGTVENNGTFYRLPARETFEQWRARTPDGFVMAVKASRYLTHIRRLRDPAEPVERLLVAAAGLGDRLGPVLLQLPPNMPADAGALEETLREFARAGRALALGPGGRGVRVAVEFRHQSWWSEDIRLLLERNGAALCWADRLGRPITPLWRTADWGYLRFHEGAAGRRAVAGRSRGVRLLQQRPGRRRAARCGQLRIDRPPGRPPGHRHGGARNRSGVTPLTGRLAAAGTPAGADRDTSPSRRSTPCRCGEPSPRPASWPAAPAR